MALLDVDNDGDLDIYVTNAAGTANSMFVNQLADSGTMPFVDNAVAAGADLTAEEGHGVCAGDVEDDGDTDIFVTSHGFPNRLLRNNGDGTFAVSPGTPQAPSLGGSSCAMGDVNGDGLLDIAVGHAWDFSNALALVAIPFEQNLPNELLVQQADGTFVDEAGARGMLDLAGVPDGAATITWGLTMVDFDADGDLDIIQADDQGALPSSKYDGVDRGYLQVLTNDGTGTFTAIDAGTLTAGTWMGVSVADFDCNQTLDVFGSNFGDYGIPALGEPYELGDYATRWLLGDGGGKFDDPGVGDLGTTHFAWGGVSEDFDNDGDGTADCVDDDGDGFTEAQGDCDDTDAAVNPDAEEICDDGIDNDCDGLIDIADMDDCEDPTVIDPPDVTVGGSGCASCASSVAAEPGSGAGWLLVLGLAGALGRRRRR